MASDKASTFSSVKRDGRPQEGLVEKRGLCIAKEGGGRERPAAAKKAGKTRAETNIRSERVQLFRNQCIETGMDRRQIVIN